MRSPGGSRIESNAAASRRDLALKVGHDLRHCGGRGRTSCEDDAGAGWPWRAVGCGKDVAGVGDRAPRTTRARRPRGRARGVRRGARPRRSKRSMPERLEVVAGPAPEAVVAGRAVDVEVEAERSSEAQVAGISALGGSRSRLAAQPCASRRRCRVLQNSRTARVSGRSAREAAQQSSGSGCTV